MPSHQEEQVEERRADLLAEEEELPFQTSCPMALKGGLPFVAKIEN